MPSLRCFSAFDPAAALSGIAPFPISAQVVALRNTTARDRTVARDATCLAIIALLGGMVETPTSFYGLLLHLDCFLRTRPDSRAGTQHQVFKYLRIKKTWIRLSGLWTVTRLVRIARYGDFCSHRDA